ncbi:MAG: hypothetical protein ACI9KE_000439 [Polyangiales bacterium]|jgi:hypothetical protein
MPEPLTPDQFHDLKKNMTTAVRGLFFILAVILALVLALATPLGDAIDGLQAQLMGGWYSSKTTMVLVAGGMFLLLMPLSLLAERAAVRRLRDRLSKL